MEDDNRSFATETLDEALVKKHHDMLQRFPARHHARKSDSPDSSSSTVRSRLIIEDSNGVRFAPYCLDYGGIEEDLKMAGLEEDTESWANVDDFLWLRAVQSPNWSVLPEEERLSSVSISSDGDS
uniref:C-CAP/cofactor C-like domain-containing protein n=1 Tax=Brassica campestris TaxID=3711 RepID=M4D2E6_BRACM